VSGPHSAPTNTIIRRFWWVGVQEEHQTKAVFGWAVAFEKAVVGCVKAAVRKQLWEKQKTVWLEVLPNCRLSQKYL
jgi:hypothetical protein